MSFFIKLIKTPKTKLLVWLYTFSAIIGGIITLSSTLRIPTESAKPLLFGLSIARLVLFFPILGITIFASYLLVRQSLDRTWVEIFLTKLKSKLDDQLYFGTILIISIITMIWSSNFIIQIPDIREPVTLAYFLRFQPAVLWLLMFSGQTLVALFFFRYQLDYRSMKTWTRRFSCILLILGLILLLSLWVIWMRYGLDAIDESIGWHPLGSPILFSQLLVSWGISMSFLFIWRRLQRSERKQVWITIPRFDSFTCLALWLIAFSLWMFQPLKANWFVSEPRPPNYEFYPSSDASVYDITAINLSLGAGFMTRSSPFTLRPLYSTFIAGFHQIAGFGYEPIIWMQISLLAFIPIFLYLITRRLHNRASGILVALLFIFKETNAVNLGDSISDAHAKLLLPFLPTTLVITLFLWLFIRWVQNPDSYSVIAFISGGIVGLSMLVRPEVVFLLPLLALAALLQLRRVSHLWLRGMIVMTGGLILALAPWIWRNYQLTGTIFIDSPHYRLDLLNRRYREEPIGFSLPEIEPLTTQPTPSLEIAEPTSQLKLDPTPQIQPTSIPTPLLDSLDQEISTPFPTEETQTILKPPQVEDIEQTTKGFAADVIKFIKLEPGTTTHFITNHLMNSVVQSVLVLPSTYPFTMSAVKFLGHRSPQTFWLDCCSLMDYERRTPYWPKWDGNFQRTSFVPLTITLVLVSIGLSVSWRKGKFVGLIPLLSALSYYAINALVRNSGGRYIVPVNWVGFFYFSIGLVHVSVRLFALVFPALGQVRPEEENQSEIHNNGVYTHKIPKILTIIIIILLALSLPMLELVVPEKYDQASLQSKLDLVIGNDSVNLSPSEMDYLSTFLGSGGRLLQGLSLYPRYHKPHQMGSVWRIYYDRPYSHMDFYLSYPGDTGVVLPMADPPQDFPHAREVLVFGCPQEEDIQALSVVIFSADGTIQDILWRSHIPDLPACPLPIVE